MLAAEKLTGKLPRTLQWVRAAGHRSGREENLPMKGNASWIRGTMANVSTWQTLKSDLWTGSEFPSWKEGLGRREGLLAPPCGATCSSPCCLSPRRQPVSMGSPSFHWLPPALFPSASLPQSRKAHHLSKSPAGPESLSPVPVPLFIECANLAAQTGKDSSPPSSHHPHWWSAVPEGTGLQRGASARRPPHCKEGPRRAGGARSLGQLTLRDPETWLGVGDLAAVT